MKGHIHNLTISDYECSLYLPSEYYTSHKNYPIVYINGDSIEQEFMEDIEPHFGADCGEFILLGIQSKNWNEDFTPWPAKPLTKKGESFEGGALDYLNILTNTIKPFIDEHYKTKPEPSNTALIGYSLGGLVSLYALYNFGAFGKIGSLSGSLWYDDWIEFMNSHAPVNVSAKVYMSLGKVEEKSRNKRMAKVGSCTREAFEILEKQLSFKENITLDWNEGGHFTKIPYRFKKALLWLMKDMHKFM